MFDVVRKHQRLMQLLLLVLIFPAFAFFGIQGYEQFFSSEGAVAKVGSSKITQQEFEQAQRRQLEQLRQMLGQQVDAAALDTPQARARILDGLIAQRALLAEAASERISIPDEQVRRTIRTIPGLASPDGGFDVERYRSLLRAQGKNEVMFENEVRSDLALQTLPEAVSQTVMVPAALVDRIIEIAEQTREIRTLAFRTEDYAAKVSPTEAQLKAYYEQHAVVFEVPENAKVQYLVLSADAVARQVKVSEADARAYYDQNKARFATPEERRASHILIKVEPGASEAARKAARAKAEAVLAQLRAGADFAALARAESQDPGSAPAGGDLGFFSADMMAKPFADAVFALKPGQTSDIVETEFGFHIIRLAEVRPGSQRSFESARSEIESEIRAQQSSTRFAEAADTFSNLVYEQPDSLEPAAERFGLTVQGADHVERSGVKDLPRESPLNNPRLLEALFSADSIATKRNTEAVDVGSNTLVSARIVDYRPVQRKPFETVQDEVRRRYTQDAAHELAVQAGTARLAALRGGEAASGFGSPRSVSRAAAADFPAAAVEAVFGASAGKLPVWMGADLGAQGYAVYQIDKVVLPDEKRVADRRDAYRQQLSQAYAQQALADYVEAVRARSKVVTYPERLAPSQNR